MGKILEELVRQIIAFTPKGVTGLIIFLLFWVGGAALQKILRRVGKASSYDKKGIFTLAGSAGKSGLILFGAITALGTMGINVSALVAGLGLTGFALGFALRDALSNLLAGALIIIYRPFQSGDRISISGCEGVVAEINLRYTALMGKDKTFLIPNSTLLTNTVSLLGKEQ